ncbi:Type IV pilus biogenesis protein PilN [Methylophaga thiooxydans]|uniref:Fimbrial assembly protein n=2 Tax=Methylophaga thiooxydans TaxID=392484 RepID=C0N3G0_9GAMM|nr:PilN domain-containing protein [Methylophaga thiooxydans]EEF80673.1 Fimbrial assembly protein [Methylophaga thiooxydans DMS010]KGM07649.1 Type IV pilus biogenesis protein PilN [Methylophaga thiooxydans]
MAHINLLPWREELREERQKQFYMALIASFVFAGLVLYAVLSYANGLIDEQNQRNTFLQQEIVKVDKKIKEIKDLEKQRERLLARMQVIQELQESRPKIVKVFDSLPRLVPEGVNLERVKRTGNKINFDGVAQSNARVSVFMSQVDNNEEYGESRLNVIKRTSSKDNAIRKFTVEVNESKLKSEDGEK